MNQDDPKFTAYALGEGQNLSEEDIAEIEKALKENRDLRIQYEEIRAVSGLLESAFSDEPEEDLTNEQKRSILTASGHDRDEIGSVNRITRFPWWPILGAAASVSLIVVITSVYLRQISPTEPAVIADEKQHARDGVMSEAQHSEEVKSASERKGGEIVIAAVHTDAGSLSNREVNLDEAEGEQLLAANEIDVVPKTDWLVAAEGRERTTPAQNRLDTEFDIPSVVTGVSDPESSHPTDQSPILALREPTVDFSGSEKAETDTSDAAGAIALGKSKTEGATSLPSSSLADSQESLLAFVIEDHRAGESKAQPSQARRGLQAGERKRIFLAKESPMVARSEDKSRVGAVFGYAIGSLGGVREEAHILPYPYPIPEPPAPPLRWPIPIPPHGDFNTESYDSITDNPFVRPEGQNALSTFSIDVDTASYANVRRFLSADRLPPKDAVRLEELINYFPYDTVGPEGDEHPFAVHVEVAAPPWKADHRLVRIALKGKEIDWEDRVASNVVFLIDVSGSMRPLNKLPLVKKSLEMLTRRFGKRDRVAIVTYAGASRVALPSTTANNTETILHAIRALGAGGSTHASAGIEEAYEIAGKHFTKGGNNRVILCTDGDFNVGVTDRGALVRLVEEKAQKGIFLTILGFGMGNLKEATLEELSNRGNGNYGYIDTQREARKVFVEQVAGTMLTIAKDVKVQVEFNPARVEAYRLIGYENRKLAAQDFNDDTKDAGEIGAGHTVTALYEVVPSGVELDLPNIDPLKYQKSAKAPRVSVSDELLTVKLRYKLPDEKKSKLLDIPVIDPEGGFDGATEDFRFVSSVAVFGMILRDSPYKGESTFEMARSIAERTQGNNRGGYRSEFLHLIDQAEMIMERESKDRSVPPPSPLPEEPVHPLLR